MRGRRAYAKLLYNGADVTVKVEPYLTGMTYTDPASGEADSLDVTVHDRERKWVGAWLPQEGDTMEATIGVLDWDGPGDSRELSCGTFLLDEPRFSGWPLTASISGVSVPADTDFRETERSKIWENVTIREIGKEIAGRAGISLVWDAADDPPIVTLEQSSQTDCAFFMDLCDAYGLSVKIYRKRLVVFDREAYKARASVGTLLEGDLEDLDWSRVSARKTYTGGEFTYTDPVTEEEIRVTVGGGPRVLKKNGRADSRADAERKIRAAVAKANHGAVSLGVTILGGRPWVASQCIDLPVLGKLGGKYYIDKITHQLGGKYTESLELSRVE